VLVVDDDEDIRESLRDFLEDHGYETSGAGHGREALDQLARPDARPCLIILDLMMPVMDGKTFRDEQVRNPRLADIPVIIISAFRDSANMARDLRVPNHLPKPLNLDVLLTMIRENCQPN
jgi:CheY-like chemotaxis protein